LKSFWPGDQNKAPTNTDTCKHFAIWGDELEEYGAQSEDFGSAVFGKAMSGDRVEFVGLLVSAWSDKTKVPFQNCLQPGVALRLRHHESSPAASCYWQTLGPCLNR